MNTSSQVIDLLAIAQAEQQGDLFSHLDGLFARSQVSLSEFPDAVLWEGGNAAGGVHAVTHAFTDMFALNGTIMALDVLGLPFTAVPMMAQYRHDMKLAPLDWFGAAQGVTVKWSTAGDFLVNEGGKKIVVMGKSGNAALRKKAGVYCNVRPYGSVTSVRCMPCLPYSQDKKVFRVDPATGDIHSEMNTPGVRLAYAARHFLKLVHETGSVGRVATKPTQAQEDAIIAGVLRRLMKETRVVLERQYSVDPYEEQRENVEAIIALLPNDFFEGMASWGGVITEHIADTNYGILQHDLLQQKEAIVFATDLDGDRLTDLMADSPGVLKAWAKRVLDHVGSDTSVEDLWSEMGFTMTNGRDMTSVMYRMNGGAIFEQTLGSADAMMLRLLAGDETVGGTKDPYDPRIHFVLLADAYKAANPDNKMLHTWLDTQISVFDSVYGGPKRPGYIEGYMRLKEVIQPWGSDCSRTA